MHRKPETQRSHYQRSLSGFYAKYLDGFGLDIDSFGYETVLNSALHCGHDVFSWDRESQDYVFANYVLQALEHPGSALLEWYRVLADGGFMIVAVPKSSELYKPSKLMQLIETSLPIDGFRLAFLEHSAYDKEELAELVCVIEKVKK